MKVNATRMFESMARERMPIRAKVSDVALTIFDRTDALMLSGETAVGIDPATAVEMMNKIIKRAEKEITPVEPEDVTSPKRMVEKK